MSDSFFNENDFATEGEAEASTPITPVTDSAVDSTEEDVSNNSVLVAAFRQGNLIPKAISYFDDTHKAMRLSSGEAKRSGDELWREIPEKYQEYADYYKASQSKEESDLITKYLDQRHVDERTLQSHGWAGLVARVAAGTLDPTILLPGMGVVKGLKTGAALAKGAATGAAYTAVAAGIQAGVNEAVDPGATAADAGKYVLGAAALGAVIGGAAGGISSAVRNMHAQNIERIATGTPTTTRVLGGTADEPTLTVIDDGITSRSAGAAEFVGTDAGRIGGVYEPLVKIISGPKVLQSVAVRGLTAQSTTMNDLTSQLFQHGITLKKNLEGIASPISVETKISRDMADVRLVDRVFNEAYLKSINETSSMKAAYKGFKDSGKSKAFFTNEVGKAMRRGGEANSPEVAAAAKASNTVITKYFKEMKLRNLLPEHVQEEDAATYLTRLWDKTQVVGRKAEFTKRIWIAAKSAATRGHESFKGLDDIGIQEKAQEYIDTIVYGNSQNSIGLNKFFKDYASAESTPGFTKERTDWIRDLDFEDFLNNDALEITKAYVRQASALIHLDDNIKAMGFDDVRAVRNAIVDEGDKLAEGKSFKQAQKIQAKARKEGDLAIDMFNMILDKYGAASKADQLLAYIRKSQVMQMMGGQVLSSLPDLAMPIFRHGLGPTFKSYLTMLTNRKIWDMNMNDLKSVSLGVETEMNHILASLVDDTVQAGEVYTSKGLRKYFDYMVGNYSKVNLSAYYNNFGKRMAGHTAMNRISRDLFKWRATGQMSQKNRTALAQHGLDEAMFNRVLGQIDKHSVEIDGARAFQVLEWEDEAAAEAFLGSTKSFADSTLITPSRADVPLSAAKHGWAKNLFQFKSFNFASTTRVLVSALQRRDKEVMAGIVGLLSLSVIQFQTKRLIRGEELETDPMKLMYGAFMGAGLTSVLMGYISGIVYPGQFKSYRDNQQLTTIGGPLFGNVQNSLEIFNRLQDGKYEQAADRAVGMLWYQNLWYLRQGFETLTKEDK
jgi:hypothetical protein